MSQSRVRVLVADDSMHMRRELRALFDLTQVQIVSEAADGREAVDRAGADDVDVAIIDLDMPVLNGIEAIRQIREKSVRTVVLVLSGHRDPHQVLGALEAGARGYVAKADAGDELGDAIHEVLHGNLYLSTAITHVLQRTDAKSSQTE